MTEMTDDSFRSERALLGSLLRWNATIDDVVLAVDVADFRAHAHQLVYAAIVHLRGQGLPADTVTVADLLQRRGQIDDVKYTYLAQLWDNEPVGAGAMAYAAQVAEEALRRRLRHAACEIVAAVDGKIGSAHDLVADAEAKIFSVACHERRQGAIPLKQCLSEASDAIDARCQRQGASGIPSGFLDLDKITAGWQDAELVIVGARPSCGKTSFACQVSLHAAGEGHGVLFCSLEQSHVELAERMMCNEARVNSLNVRRGILPATERDDLLDALHRLSAYPVWIDRDPHQNVSRIAATGRRLKSKGQLKMIVVDYLQLVEPEDKKDVRQEQVAGISRGLKRVANELAVPVLALAQVNRRSEDRSSGRPTLADLRESGAMEADADVVVLLHRPRDAGQVQDTVEAIVAKNRNGPTGEVTLAFQKEYMRFDNYVRPLQPAATVNGRARARAASGEKDDDD